MDYPEYIYTVYTLEESGEVRNLTPCYSKETASNEVLDQLKKAENKNKPIKVVTERSRHRDAVVKELPSLDKEADIEEEWKRIRKQELLNEEINQPLTTTKEAKQ